MMTFNGGREAAYARAIAQLDDLSKMQPEELRAHDVSSYEQAIRNLAYLFEVGLDVVVCDLQAYRVGHRSQEAAA